MHQATLTFQTKGRGTMDITDAINKVVHQEQFKAGLCHCFIKHTSASLIVCENADPIVRRDLETFMQHCVPDGDSLFQHTQEGPDDMPAHIRTILTQTSLSIPVKNTQLDLGTWQGIYLWEHRLNSFRRQLVITLLS